MSDEGDNPLTDLYVDTEDVNRAKIRDALSGLIGIDDKSGRPLFEEGFESLTSKEQFTALLLYRQALAGLDELDDDETVGEGSTYFADLIGVDGSTIRHASSDLEFVTSNEERGGYVIQPHKIEQAASWLASEQEE